MHNLLDIISILLFTTDFNYAVVIMRPLRTIYG